MNPHEEPGINPVYRLNFQVYRGNQQLTPQVYTLSYFPKVNALFPAQRSACTARPVSCAAQGFRVPEQR